jgi:SulP family sulfate permease
MDAAIHPQNETSVSTGRGDLLPAIAAGLVIGFTEVIFAASLGSLIFAGPLSDALPRGIGMMLMAATIHILFTACFASFDGVIASVQDNPAVLMAVAAASLASMIGADEALVPSVIALIILSTLLAGVFLLVLGGFRLGGLVRYIPYPVIGGFLAGSGWLLATGSIGTMADYALTAENLSALLRPDQIALWLPGVIFGLTMFVGLRLSRHALTMPVILLAQLAAFYLGLLISGTSIESAIARGLLIGQVSDAGIWQPPVGELTRADWGAVLGQSGSIAAILGLTAVTLLLNVSGIEVALRREISFDRELRLSGAANLLSAIAGGSIGFHGLSFTSLVRRMRARGRLPAFIAGSICLLALVAGSAIIAYAPKALLGGLLLFLGLEFLNDWVIAGRRNFNTIDYAVVLITLATIALFGFLVGVAVGLALMCGLFIVSYSRLSIIYRASAGNEVSSHVTRSVYHQRVLAQVSGQIYVLELQGFIFFGTANALVDQVRRRLKSADTPLTFLVLDFRRVQGADSSALYSLNKLVRLAETHHLALLYCHLPRAIREAILQRELTPEQSIFPDLDHALEWCEDQLLERDQVTRLHLPATLPLQLAESGFSPEETLRLKSYLKPIDLEPGEVLLRQGDSSASMYFIELGQVSVYMELAAGKRLRVQTLGMGTTVGELGFFLEQGHTATVIADEHTRVYALKRTSLAAMEQNEPDLAFAFNALMLRLMCERLTTANDLLTAMSH